MSSVLYIKASPRGYRSHSISVADAFMETYQETNVTDLVTTKNLFEEELPPFDGPALQASYNVMRGLTHDQEQIKAWRIVQNYVDELKACSKIVMAVPMWNFSIPYRLKHYLDLVVQPGLSFGVNESGYFGIIEDKPVFIVYARGGQYPSGSAAAGMDHQRPYLEMILNFMGLKDLRSVCVEGTLSSEAQVAEILSGAIAKAREIARIF